MLQKIFLRTAYNYDMDAVSQETGLKCQDPSLAQQHMKDEADINVIVERFGLTGRMPAVKLEPMFGDFSNVGDYQSALAAISLAESQFAALPAEIRATFDNNPAGFVDFALNPANREVLARSGLLAESEADQRARRVSEVAEGMRLALAAQSQNAPEGA